MVDAASILKAKKAKILADAQRAADAVDVDLRDLERFRELADKYGLDLVEKVNGHVALVDGVFFDPDGPAYKAAISISENAIRAAGGPLELSQLYDACVSAGVKLGGKRPQSTLSAYLSHDRSTVKSIRKGVYDLKGKPAP
jgi:hypothetical protein